MKKIYSIFVFRVCDILAFKMSYATFEKNELISIVFLEIFDISIETFSSEIYC